MHHRAGLRAVADFEGLEPSDAAELSAAEGRDVAEAIFGEPAGAALAHQHAGNGVHAAANALAGHEDVGLDAVLRDAPQLAGAHQTGLHLIGDIQGVVLLA